MSKKMEKKRLDRDTTFFVESIATQKVVYCHEKSGFLSTIKVTLPRK